MACWGATHSLCLHQVPATATQCLPFQHAHVPLPLRCAAQVRDALTTTHEQQLLRSGGQTSPTLSRDAVVVDAIVNTGVWACGLVCGQVLGG